MSSNILTKKLYIKDMTCVNCENTIERELSKAVGIQKVRASYSSGTATVTYDASVIGLAEIIGIIEGEGYKAKVDMPAREEAPTAGSSMNSFQNSKDEAKRTSEVTDRNTNIIATLIILFALYMIANRFGLLNILSTFPVAKDGMGYGMLFLIGLLTSVHCVAMCGGICLSQCVPQKEGEPIGRFVAIKPSLLYNMGRVISYTIVGALVGALGSVVSFTGPMKGIVQILAGVFMVIMGLNMLNIFPWLRKFNPRMPRIFAKAINAERSKRNNSPLYIGLLNGLMPCGPLQAMQLYALSTGSPIKGAIAMFLFSIGTVPLMFAFGALSSFLSKKFTGKMMTASAVLVLVLGAFMFSSGLGLSGVVLPTIPILSNSSAKASVAIIKDGVQVVTTGLASGRYEPIIVQKGIPVRWVIQAEKGDINGCNNSILIPKYNIQKDLALGDNAIEFTPTESGTISFSCWMGMIRSRITVVDDLNEIDKSAIAE